MISREGFEQFLLETSYSKEALIELNHSVTFTFFITLFYYFFEAGKAFIITTTVIVIIVIIITPIDE